ATMEWACRLRSSLRVEKPNQLPRCGELKLLRGTIQRVDYRRRQLRVIADGQLWQGNLAADCHLWFEGVPAILRCFHPLDPVTILSHERDADHLVRAMYSWEPFARAEAEESTHS